MLAQLQDIIANLSCSASLWHYVVSCIIHLLLNVLLLGFTDRFGHRVSDAVNVQDRFTIEVTRAARLIVWINERSERSKPSLSASKIATRDTSGIPSPSRNRLMPHQHVKFTQAQVTNDFNAFHGIAISKCR